MDKNINIEESNGDDIKSQCALLSFSCRVGNMIDLTPDEWEISFKSIEKRVSYLISAKDKEVLLEVCDLVIELSYTVTLTSFCNFCSRSEIDESTRKTLSGLFILFSRAVIELNIPNSNSLSSDFISISKDPTQLRNKRNLISLFSHYMFEYLDEHRE